MKAALDALGLLLIIVGFAWIFIFAKVRDRRAYLAMGSVTVGCALVIGAEVLL